MEKKAEPYLDVGMSFNGVGRTFAVLIHKSRWKISVKESFYDVACIISEILENVESLVDLIKKIDSK